MQHDETLEVGLAAGLDIPTAMVLSEINWETEDSLLFFFTVISLIGWILKG